VGSANSGEVAHVNPLAWPFPFDETGVARGRPSNSSENKAKGPGEQDYSSRYFVISSEGSEIEYRSSRRGSAGYLHVVLGCRPLLIPSARRPSELLIGYAVHVNFSPYQARTMDHSEGYIFPPTHQVSRISSASAPISICLTQQTTAPPFYSRGQSRASGCKRVD
jgi:hypothetical protein